MLAMAVDEMNLLTPWRNCLHNVYRKAFSSGADPAEVVVGKLKRGEIAGAFWRKLDHHGIEYSELYNAIQNSGGYFHSAMAAILELISRKEEKPRVGVKYPLHIGYFDILLKWFPDSKIVLLARSPFATISSKLNDTATRRRKERIGILGFMIHYLTLLVFCVDYRELANVVERASGIDNAKIVSYENLIRFPQKTLTELCEFCEIPFELEMLNATGKPSSYGESQDDAQIHISERLNSWKEHLSHFDKLLIQALTRRAKQKIESLICSNAP